jgi:hypothetical protein
MKGQSEFILSLPPPILMYEYLQSCREQCGVGVGLSIFRDHPFQWPSKWIFPIKIITSLAIEATGTLIVLSGFLMDISGVQEV